MRIVRSIIIGTLVLVLPVCGLQWGYYAKFRAGMLAREIASQDAIADMQRDRMEAFVASNLDRLDLVTSRRIFRELLVEYLARHDQSIQFQLNRSLSDVRRATPIFDVLSVADTKGRILTSTDNALIGTDVSSEEAFKEGAKRNAITLVFYEEGNNEEAQILLSGPMVIDEKIVAVALLKTHPAELLSILRGPGNVAENYWTLAQRADALHLTLIRPSDNGSALVHSTVPEDSGPHLVEAMRGADLTIIDDGPPVHTHVTRFVPDVGWALLGSHDISSIMETVNDFRKSLLLLSLLLMTYVVGVSLYLGRVGARSETRSHH